MIWHEFIALLTALTPLVQQTAILLNAVLAGATLWQARKNGNRVKRIEHQTNAIFTQATESAYREGKAHAKEECEEATAQQRARDNTAMNDAGETMTRLV